MQRHNMQNRAFVHHILDVCVCLAALQCDANSTYSSCMTPCPSSCADLAAPAECDAVSCVEGCQCAAGFVMSEGTCVPYTQCGCTFLNRYYPVSCLQLQHQHVCVCVTLWAHVLLPLPILQLKEKFVTEDCAQSCECSSTGAVCQPKTCQDGYVCAIYNFKRDCYRGVCVFITSMWWDIHLFT